MKKYQIKIELLSEAIFGSGEAVPGDIDIEILYDSYGLPYLKAKTIKGLIREQMEQIIYAISKIQGLSENEEIVIRLFGKKFNASAKESRKDRGGLLNFSDANVHPQIQEVIKKGVKSKKITPQEVLSSLTQERFFIEIDENGLAKDHSLRKARVLNKGLLLYVDITVQEDISLVEEVYLAAAVKGVRHAGTMRSKGKGYIDCILLKNDEDVSKANGYFKQLFERREIV